MIMSKTYRKHCLKVKQNLWDLKKVLFNEIVQKRNPSDISTQTSQFDFDQRDKFIKCVSRLNHFKLSQKWKQGKVNIITLTCCSHTIFSIVIPFAHLKLCKLLSSWVRI